jgi:hypothetical protein
LPEADETLPKAMTLAHFCSMWGAKFCAMEITQAVARLRREARWRGLRPSS